MGKIITDFDKENGYMHVQIYGRPYSNFVSYPLDIDEENNIIVGMRLLNYEKFIDELKILMKKNPSEQEIIEYMLYGEDYKDIIKDFSDENDTREKILEIADHLVNNF